MNTKTHTKARRQLSVSEEARLKLLKRIPINEQWLQLAGISTAILEGGSGPPLILLHGPGGSSFWWMRTIPRLVTTHRLIIPDMPGHGASRVTDGNTLDGDRVLEWLRELIDNTCTEPPVLVGHVLGGVVAARFAVDHSDYISGLVLVDTLGLSTFRPTPGFAFRLIHFLMGPSRKRYDRLLSQCMYDADSLRSRMGSSWEPFLAYYLSCIRDPEMNSALGILMRQIGIPAIPKEDLARITAPISLIWGRHDRANRLKVAEAASARYGWPLHIIENAADDPKFERPEEFVDALYKALAETEENKTKQYHKNLQ